MRKTYRQNREGSVDPKATGWDLVLSEEGDLKQGRGGDLYLSGGVESIVSSVIRRIKTPRGIYEKWLPHPEGWVPSGVGYGSRLAFYQSQSNIDTLNLEDEIKQVLDKETRITVFSVQVIKQVSDFLEIKIRYRIKGESEIIEEKVSF